MRKINIVIGILTLVLTTLITAISIFYYSFILSDRQFERTKQAAQNASETLSYNYKNIMDRLTAICGTAEFSSDIRMLASPSVSYIVQERLVQNELSDLAGCNYLVQSALVLSGDGKTAYSLYKNPLPDTAEFFTEEECSRTRILAKKDKINDKNFAIYLVLNLFYFGFIVSFQ